MFLSLKKPFRYFSMIFILSLLTACICDIKEEAKEGGEPVFIEVSAMLQTVAVRDSGDAADDPAIWIHPERPEESLIIGTNKLRGLAVYNLKGQEVYFSPVGRVNNTDVRYDFPLKDRKVDIVVASNRTHNSITIMEIRPGGELTKIVSEEIISGISEVYGICLYHNRNKNEYYVVVNSKEGELEQWLLMASGNNTINAELQRSFHVGGQTEGCVADDENGFLYVGQEDHGIWKYFADPERGDERTLVDDFSNPHLQMDIEGLTLYRAKNGYGYLIASSQGNNSYAVYDRMGDNEYIGSFRIIDGTGGIDGTSETDGIDVISLDLGPSYPHGFFIAQDGYNYTGEELSNQNFKMVRWEHIANSFDPPLIIDNTYNPRD